MSTTNSEDTFENACVVCFKNVEIFSIGDCDHPVCYECSTRMRVLCRQNECPICRQDMTKVVFTQDVRPYKELKNGTYLMDKKFQICFDTPEIQRAYNALLAHVCSKCHGRHAFQNFNNLRDHMRREHELHYCDLCIDNLMILTCERRCYTRQELAQHRRRGDPDDRSHKGHPLCEFCDTRYMDNDELYRHLRRDHLFCHFCDADGFHQYYSSYDFLRDHFRKEHYLCEEGGCYEEKFTAVFRTEIDLKAHRASVHGRSIGKAAAKQARTLELEFTLAPRPRDNRDRGRGGQRNVRLRPENREEDEGAVGGMYFDCQTTPQYMNPPASMINTDCIDEFPSLGGNAVSSTHRPSSRKTSGLTIRAGLQGGLAVTDENFPALGPEATLSLRVNTSSSGERPISSIVTSKPTNVSIHLNHRPSSGVSSGIVTTRVSSSQNVRLKEKDPFPALSNQFPALSNTKMAAPIANTVATQWSSGKESESKLSLVKSKSPTQPPPKPPQPKTFHIEDDFPSLSTRFDTGCSVKLDSKPHDTKYKKASSISIPVADNRPSVAKESNNGNISSDSDIGNKKSSKKKKKKSGINNASSSNNSSGNETKPNAASFKKINNNTTNVEKDKKKKQKDETNKIEAGKKRQENQENEKPEIVLTERKRSELMIGKLVSQSQPEMKMDINDFPVLGNSRPPGFSEISKAPPGFENTNSKSTPPPGFSITLNSVARPPSNDLTFTNSSGQSYPITPGSSIPSSAYSFVPPNNFNQRNGDLVDKVVASLKNPGELDEFRQMSSAFRQNLITAKGYYNHCQTTMGNETFTEIFPELIVLLPDIEKQQELWSVYQTTDRSISTSKPSKLDICATCSQVISTSDLRQHMMGHALENHFPALANGTVQTNNAWVKK